MVVDPESADLSLEMNIAPLTLRYEEVRGQEATKSRVTDGGEPLETPASSGDGALGAYLEDTVIHLPNMRFLCFPLSFEVSQHSEGNEEETRRPRRQ